MMRTLNYIENRNPTLNLKQQITVIINIHSAVMTEEFNTCKYHAPTKMRFLQHVYFNVAYSQVLQISVTYYKCIYNFFHTL